MFMSKYVYIYQILGTKFWEYSQTEYLKFDTHSVYVNYGRNYFVSKYLNYKIISWKYPIHMYISTIQYV